MLPVFCITQYGRVLECVLCVTDKARDRNTGEYVALKKLRMDRERDGEASLADYVKLHASLVPS